MWASVTICPYQHDHAFVKPAQTFQPLLAVVRASVFISQHWKIEYAFTLRQIDAVLRKIRFALRLVKCDHVKL